MPFIRLTSFDSDDNDNVWLNTDYILSIWPGTTTEQRKDGKQEFTGIAMVNKSLYYAVHEPLETVLRLIAIAGGKVVNAS